MPARALGPALPPASPHPPSCPPSLCRSCVWGLCEMNGCNNFACFEVGNPVLTCKIDGKMCVVSMRRRRGPSPPCRVRAGGEDLTCRRPVSATPTDRLRPRVPLPACLPSCAAHTAAFGRVCQVHPLPRGPVLELQRQGLPRRLPSRGQGVLHRGARLRSSQDDRYWVGLWGRGRGLVAAAGRRPAPLGPSRSLTSLPPTSLSQGAPAQCTAPAGWTPCLGPWTAAFTQATHTRRASTSAAPAAKREHDDMLPPPRPTADPLSLPTHALVFPLLFFSFSSSPTRFHQTLPICVRSPSTPLMMTCCQHAHRPMPAERPCSLAVAPTR